MMENFKFIIELLLKLFGELMGYKKEEPEKFKRDLSHFQNKAIKFLFHTINVGWRINAIISLIVHILLFRLLFLNPEGRIYFLMALSSAICVFITYNMYSVQKDLKKFLPQM